MSEHHLYKDGTDTVSATNEKEADRVWEKYYEDTRESYGFGKEEWSEIPDDTPIEILFCERDPDYVDIPPGGEAEIEHDPKLGITVRAYASSWAKFYPDKIVCSTEWSC